MTIHRLLRHPARLIRGAVLRRHAPAYSSSWWDESFYTSGISDRQTIAADKSPITSAYHYASVEMLIARHLLNARFAPAAVCDLGSGSGHWIDWYRSLGATRVVGIDVSARATEYLAGRYGEDVTIRQGAAHDVLPTLGEPFDLLNAIGVMFHVVDDAEWTATIRAAADALRPGGFIVASGYFGRITANVGLTEGHVYKRLRNLATWRRALYIAGFEGIAVHRNYADRSIPDTLPENSVLIARRS